jgi:hypothetical protein
MKVSPAAMIIVGDDVLGVPLGGARLEFSQTMPAYKDGRPFCPCIIPHFFKELTYSSTNVQKHMI